MTERIDHLYTAMGDMLVDYTHEETKIQFEAFQRLHYRLHKLNSAERAKLITFWMYVTELYHSHRYLVTDEYDFHLEWEYGEKLIQSPWLFLLDQCIQLSQQVISENIEVTNSDVLTTRTRISEVEKVINLMYLLIEQRELKPALYMWYGVEYKDTLNKFYSLYQQLRMIAVQYTSEQPTYTKKITLPMTYVVKKRMYMCLLRICQRNAQQGHPPSWLNIMLSRTSDKLCLLQTQMFEKIQPKSNTNTFQKILDKAYDADLADQVRVGLVDNFDCVCLENICWQWNLNAEGVIEFYSVCDQGIDISKHNFQLREETKKSEIYNLTLQKFI